MGRGKRQIEKKMKENEKKGPHARPRKHSKKKEPGTRGKLKNEGNLPGKLVFGNAKMKIKDRPLTFGNAKMRKRWVAWKRQNEKQRKKMIKENVKRFWIKRQVVETQKRETDAKNGKQKAKDVCVILLLCER